ncbi:MAG: Gfo/Idh/MocA family protein, partial [Gammaproteobacteria bacterium]
MKALVVGAGMYVTGRGTGGIGTLLPALAQYSRVARLDAVTVLATRAEADSGVPEAAARINALLGSSLKVDYRRLDGPVGAAVRAGEFDCALVCVPDDKHYEVTAALLERGLHCLVVKPFTPTLAEARKLVDLAARKNLHGAVEFHKRHDEQNLLARRVLREGRLGEPKYMVVGYSQRIDVPLVAFRAWAARTNIFQYLGVHYVDLIQFLTGFTPLRVSAVGTRGTLRAQGVDTYDSVHATIGWQPQGGGAEFVAQLAIGWIDPATTPALSDQKFFLVGSRGRIDLDQADRGVRLVTPEAGVETPNPHFSMVLGEHDETAFRGYGYRSIERFLRDAGDVAAGRV